MCGLLGHVGGGGGTWGDRHKMVALATSWVTCVPSQDAGPGLGPQVRRSSPVGTRPGCI